MKKSALTLASLLLAFTGCGQGWLPLLNRGGSCLQGGCRGTAAVAPVSTGGCNTCGDIANNTFGGTETVTSGFSGIDNGLLPYDGQVISSGPALGGTIYNGDVVAPGIVPGSIYEGAPTQSQ